MFSEIIDGECVDGFSAAMAALGSGGVNVPVLRLDGSNAVRVSVVQGHFWVKAGQKVDDPNYTRKVTSFRELGVRIDGYSKLKYYRKSPRWGTARGPDFELATVYCQFGTELVGPYWTDEPAPYAAQDAPHPFIVGEGLQSF
jgi:hypothetical protein